jgi:hypothetical protein
VHADSKSMPLRAALTALAPCGAALARGSACRLKQLCRYITRPAIANERLKRNRAGQVVLQLKSPYKDGTTHIVMEPLEFMERLAALVPRPRLHLIRFHGVLAPNAKLRGKIVPAPAERATETSSEDAQAPSAPAPLALNSTEQRHLPPRAYRRSPRRPRPCHPRPQQGCNSCSTVLDRLGALAIYLRSEKNSYP